MIAHLPKTCRQSGEVAKVDLSIRPFLRLEVLLQQEGKEEEAVCLGRQRGDCAVERRRVEAANNERFKLLRVGARCLAERGQLLCRSTAGEGESRGGRGAGGAGSCGEGVGYRPSSVGSGVLNGAHTHLAYDLIGSVRLFFGCEHELEVDLHLAQVLGAIGERNGHLRERAAHVSCETDCCSSEEQGQPARERQWRVVRAGRSGEDRAVWRRRGRSKRLRSR